MTARAQGHRALCYVFVALCAAASAWLLQSPSQLGTAYLGLHGALTVLMLGIWCLGLTLDDRTSRRVLNAGCVALLVLLPAPALTTHDSERYLWDGRVAYEGHDPYRLAPDAPQLADLRARWPTPAEHAAYTTLYPPAALALFTFSAAFGPEWAPRIWKTLVTLAGLATLALGADLLRRHAVPQHLPLLALSPLLVLETGIGAHADVFCALSVTALLWCLSFERIRTAGAALALGTLFKLLPLFALAPVALALGLRRGARFLLAVLATLAAGYSLAFAADWQPLGSLPVFLERWRFGSPLFAAIEALAPAHALTIAAALSLCVLALALGRARRDINCGIALALCAPLLFSPVVFPWYLCVLLPLLALAPSAFLLVWVSLAPLSYEVLNGFTTTGIWAPATWPLWVLASAWLCALFGSFSRTRLSAF